MYAIFSLLSQGGTSTCCFPGLVSKASCLLCRFCCCSSERHSSMPFSLLAAYHLCRFDCLTDYPMLFVVLVSCSWLCSSRLNFMLVSFSSVHVVLVHV